MEAAGVVDWAQEESEFKVGDRVSAFWILGGYAEKVVVPVGNVTRSPAELNDAEAVSLLVNHKTMYFALARRAAMRQGDTVLVLGSAGGVGTAAIQVAKAMGASKVIAVVHRTAATGFVESLGADVVLPLADGWRRRSASTPTVAVWTSWSIRSAARPSTTPSGYWLSTASCW